MTTKRTISTTLLAIGMFTAFTVFLAHANDGLSNSLRNGLNYDPNNVTVSGLSSGGYMATQMHIAHSDSIHGAAILAAGPYYCAQGSIGTALARCVTKTDSPIDLTLLNDQLDYYAQQEWIAPLQNLQDDKVWLLHGLKDTTVNRLAADALYTQYTNLMPSVNVSYIKDQAFGHQFPTDKKGSQCGLSEKPFIGQCNYDAAGQLLTYLLGPLHPKSTQLNGNIVKFDQQTYAGETANTIADDGYIYIPQNCAQGNTCRLHVSFHGCNQNASAIGMDYIENTGLNEWADSNNLIILYPQTKSSMFAPLNPQGCWDWWGYTDRYYATTKGPQIKAIHTMINTFTHQFPKK